MERVEIYEPIDRGGSGELREGDYVYNIEVEQNHNYFADGLLVHNCHHTSAGTWAKALQHFCSAKVLGPTPTWLTDNGYLAPARVYAPPIGFSEQELRRQMGDFDRRQAAGALGGCRIPGDAVSHYQHHLAGRRRLPSAARSPMPRRCPTPSPSVGSGRPASSAPRASQRADSSWTSCSLIGEGVHLQMIGSCLRPQPGKEAVILDHVGNIERLGHHLDTQEWNLDGIKKREHPRSPSVKTCPQCFCAMASTLSLCPECGNVFRPERQKLVTVEGELREISQQEIRSRRKKEQGLKTPQCWARHVLAGRQTRGHWSRVA